MRKAVVTILMIGCVMGAYAKDLKVCFVAGPDSHGYDEHAHGPGLQYLMDELNKSMPEIKTIIHKGGWPSDKAFFDGASAVVIYSDGGAGHMVMKHLEELDKLAEAGVGIACIHYAVELPKGQAGEYMLKWTGGYFEANWSVNPHWPAEFKSFPDHPVTRGLKPFTLADEWYFHMRFRENMEGVTPVLSAVPPRSTIARADGPHSNNPVVRKEVAEGLPQHLAWVSEREGGKRGFGFTGGHWHRNWKDDNFRKFVLNAVVWTAGGEVPDNGVVTETPTDEALNAYLGKK